MPEVLSTDDPSFPELAPVAEETVPEIADSTPADAPKPATDVVADEKAAEGAEAAEFTGDFKYGGVDVKVDIPEDIAEMFKGKELDVQAVCTELYSSEDFTLTAETREKLEAAFGKSLVSTYLASIKVQNDAYIAQVSQSRDAQVAANEEAIKYGEAQAESLFGMKWSELESKALEVLSDEQLAQYNSAMESGNRMIQDFAFRSLKEQLKVADTSAPDIELGGAGAPSAIDLPLSRADYIREVAKVGTSHQGNPMEYRRAMQALDARRRAALEAGII